MAEPTDKVIGILVATGTLEVDIIEGLVDNCETAMVLQSQMFDMAMVLRRRGLIANASFFIVDPEWKLNDPIDIYRCTYLDPRNKQP